MDIFKLMNWLSENRKKIIIFSHIAMAITLINLVVAMFTGRFSTYSAYFIWTVVLQFVAFVMIQIQFSNNESK